MPNLKGCFSHKSDDWSTPPDFFIKHVGCADFDPCPGKGDYKLPITTINKDKDGLKIAWNYYRVFINPPYSNIAAWVDKAISEVLNGNCHIAILLVPSRTDTKWFQKLWANRVERTSKVCPADLRTYFDFIPGRIHFSNSKNAAPFPSVLIHIIK